jgi:hypothetical protein
VHEWGEAVSVGLIEQLGMGSNDAADRVSIRIVDGLRQLVKHFHHASPPPPNVTDHRPPPEAGAGSESSDRTIGGSKLKRGAAVRVHPIRSL